MATGRISELKNVYSTSNEVPIGTWIDGKPIYRKAINFGELPNADVKSVNHGIANISQVVKVYGILNQPNTQWSFLPNAHPIPTSNIALWVNRTSISIRTGDDRRATTAYVYVEYTKT